MTTDHIDIPEEDLDRILGGLGKSAKADSDDDLLKDIMGIDQQIDNVAYGASVLVQRKLDRQEALKDEVAERVRQRELIRQRAARMRSSVTVEPTPAPADDDGDDDDLDVPGFVNDPTASQPPASPGSADDDEDLLGDVFTRDQMLGMSNRRLQLLAEIYRMDEEVTSANRLTVIARIITAQHLWCVENDVNDPNETTRTRPTPVVRFRESRHNPFSWNGWQWVGAIIGALIGIVIYLVVNDWEQDITGTWNRVLDVMLFVGLTGLGFFGGAIIGALAEDRQEHLRPRS